jgi:hypothetical protein
MSARQLHRMRAVDLAAVSPPAAGYLFRDYGDCDRGWKLVKTRVIRELHPHEGAFLPPLVTVEFSHCPSPITGRLLSQPGGP